MSARNSRAAKEARKRKDSAEVARREEAQRDAVSKFEDTLSREVTKLIEAYNSKLTTASMSELRSAAVRRRDKENDSRITGNIGRMKRDDLIEMLKMGDEDYNQAMAHGMGG